MAGTVIARTLHEAVRCPYCGTAYNLLVPAGSFRSRGGGLLPGSEERIERQLRHASAVRANAIVSRNVLAEIVWSGRVRAV